MRVLLFVVLLLGFSNNLAAQSGSYSVTFDHVALSVSDVDRSAAFYSEVLNLEEITNKTQMNGIRWFSLGEGKELHLISLLKDDVKLNKAVHFALTVSDFSSFVDKLKLRGIDYSDWRGTVGQINVRADGIKQVFFQDPDGYWIEMNSVGQK